MNRELQDNESMLQQISALTNLDLHYYKAHYLERHIAFRMERCKIAQRGDYIAYLKQNDNELRELIGNIGVNVTSFFRDADVYQALGGEIVPGIVAAKSNGGERTIRIWSTSCATGEEPYSVAIIVKEVLGDRYGDFDPLLFATDIDDAALEHAQSGWYAADKLSTVGDRLKEKYFEAGGDGKKYCVRPEIRAMVRFKRHDVIGGTPISMLDMVLCRNMLIYIKQDWQTAIFDHLHAALKAGGYLVLGKTETLPPEYLDRFRAVHLTERIYQKL